MQLKKFTDSTTGKKLSREQKLKLAREIRVFLYQKHNVSVLIDM